MWRNMYGLWREISDEFKGKEKTGGNYGKQEYAGKTDVEP